VGLGAALGASVYCYPEMAALTAALSEAEARRGRVTLIHGEAGIGKSTLWFAGIEHARTRGLRVLSSRPAEAERSLAHAGLGDLLEDVLDDVLPALSVPRQRALKVAMLRDEAIGDPVDRRAVAVAVRDVLQLLSEDEPHVNSELWPAKVKNYLFRKADAGTIRKDFGESIEQNAIHGSDSDDNAKIEIGFFFAQVDIVG